ncbi:acetylxylan esterase [Arthrobacter sp. MPF02]|uniref:acetylxylan esterase n=1 Tax=Arthrobacter sp. MPF02 TaxID=3388492 RepID=UPI0039852AA0
MYPRVAASDGGSAGRWRRARGADRRASAGRHHHPLNPHGTDNDAPFDLPLAQLRSYTSDVTAPADFTEFWDAHGGRHQGFPAGRCLRAG